jgi:hypothetical protein
MVTLIGRPIKRIFGSRVFHGRPVAAAAVVLGPVAAWLLLAAMLVDIEYYDGRSAICNARYFLGRSSFYLFDRGPLMAWVQMPAELVKDWLRLHPLEVRPHHVTMALLHVGYLLAVYGALVRRLGQQWSTFIAFATAVTSYMFFSYAPFISHDILPGALFLWMLIWSDEFARAPRLGMWLRLVAAGTLGPLVKQSLIVFWIAVLAAHILPTLFDADARHRTSPRALWWLAGGAVTSGLLAWFIYGIVLANWLPQVPVWLRPYRNLQYLAHQYDGTGVRFPLWIYVRNLWAYGRVTTLLLIPGVVLSLSGSRLQRRVAFAWIVAVAFVHAWPQREVRYLALVAPLSALLIAPAVSMLGRHKLGALLIAALLLFDVGGALTEASRVATPFYRHSEARTLLEPLVDGDRLRRPLFHNLSMLSFVAPDQSPLAADRYHRIFHVGALQIGVLYGYPAADVKLVLPHQAMALTATAPEGSVLLFSNGILAHGPTWVPGPPVGSEMFAQALATAQTIVLRLRHDDVYETSTGDVVRVEAQRQGANTTLTIDRVAAAHMGSLTAVAIDSESRLHPLARKPDGTLVLTHPTVPGSTALPESLTIRLFAIQRRSPRPLPSPGKNP